MAGFHGQESHLAASTAERGGREHDPLAADLSSLLCANLHLRHAASDAQGAPAAAAAMERIALRAASSGRSAEACASASESSSAGDSPWHPEHEAPRGPPERARPACPAPTGRLAPCGSVALPAGCAGCCPRGTGYLLPRCPGRARGHAGPCASRGTEAPARLGADVPGGPRARQACSRCGATKTPMWRNNSRGEKTLCNACGVRLHRLLNKARMGMSPARARAGAAPAADAPARRPATAGSLPSRLPAAAPGSASRARACSLPSELPDGGAASAPRAATPRSAGLPGGGQLSPPTPRKRGWADLGGGRPSPAGNAWAAQHAAGVAALHEQPPRGWPFPPFPPPPHAAPAAMPNAKLCDSVHQRLDQMSPPPLCPVDESRASDSSTTPHGHPCPSHQRRADARQAARHSLDAAPPPGCAPPPGHLQIENPLGLDPELLSAVDLRFDDLAFLQDLTDDCEIDGVRPAASPA